MRNDRSCHTLIYFLLAAVAAACAGPSVDPAEFAATLPPERQLEAGQRARVTDATAAAVAAWRRGDHVAAAREAEVALDLDPRAARALAVQAAARHRRGRAEYPPTLSLIRHAEGEMRQASVLADSDPFVALEHARLLAAEGHLSAAAVRAERQLSRPEGSRLDTNPASRDLELLRFAALLRYDLGDERASLPLLLEVQSVRPDDADVAYRIARARFRLARSSAQGSDRDQARGLWGQAIAGFEAYRALRPDDPAGPLGEAQARAAIYSADDEGAEPIFALFDLADTLAQASPSEDSPAAGCYGRGVFLEQLGRADEARAAFELAVQRDPGHAGAWLNLAASQATAGMRQAARASCSRALELDLSASERARVQVFLLDSEDPGPESASTTRR